MSDLQTVLGLIPKLSPDELQQVKEGIKACEGLGSAPTKPTRRAGKGDDTEFVLDAMVRTLSALGVEYCSISVLRLGVSTSFRKKVEDLMVYLRKADNTKIVQRAILVAGIQLLYHNMVQIGLPVSGRSVMNQLHRIPSVINRAFPTYAENGMLRWIVKTEGRNNGVQQQA